MVWKGTIPDPYYLLSLIGFYVSTKISFCCASHGDLGLNYDSS